MKCMIQVAYPHCATCFGRCYPGGSSLITDGNYLFEGLTRLLSTSSSRQLPKRVQNAETKNGKSPAVENGAVADVKETENSNTVEEDNTNNTSLQTQEKQIEE